MSVKDFFKNDTKGFVIGVLALISSAVFCVSSFLGYEHNSDSLSVVTRVSFAVSLIFVIALAFVEKNAGGTKFIFGGFSFLFFVASIVFYCYSNGDIKYEAAVLFSLIEGILYLISVFIIKESVIGKVDFRKVLFYPILFVCVIILSSISGGNELISYISGSIISVSIVNYSKDLWDIFLILKNKSKK